MLSIRSASFKGRKDTNSMFEKYLEMEKMHGMGKLKEKLFATFNYSNLDLVQVSVLTKN